MADIDRIEAQAAEERARLQMALGALRQGGGAASAMTHVGGIVHAGGRVLGQQTLHAARRNPLAFGVVGLGLGLLVTGTGARRGKRQARLAAAGAEQTAAELRAARDLGLDGLSHTARARVLAARDEAIRAQDRLEARAVRASRRSSAKRGLLMGALALGAGAVLVSLLPRKRRAADKTLWEARDLALAEAAALYEEEVTRLQHPTPRATASL